MNLFTLIMVKILFCFFIYREKVITQNENFKIRIFFGSYRNAIKYFSFSFIFNPCLIFHVRVLLSDFTLIEQFTITEIKNNLAYFIGITGEKSPQYAKQFTVV